VLLYVFLYDLIGEEIYKWVGEESSGQISSMPIFDQNKKPHNPLVNSGAIMLCALVINLNKNILDIIQLYKKASNTDNLDIDYDLSQQMRLCGHSNNALASLMLAREIFPNYETP
jgi:glutaminase